MMVIVAEAPGKVLVTGGYLVLDRAHTGVVLATDARFRVTVALPAASDADVAVDAPQFGWRQQYRLVRRTEAGMSVATEPVRAELGGNLFVETVLRHVAALADAAGRPLPPAQVTVLGGNDFYSQRAELARRGLPLTAAALATLPAYHVPEGATADAVRKTGLGSSAALVTALTAALLAHAGVVAVASPLRPEDAAVVHRLAQLCHCVAQGKVGSGFDVAAAVFGSMVYRRFPATTLAPLLQAATPTWSVPATQLHAAIVRSDRPEDDAIMRPFRLPAGVELLLGDVAAGSSTPSMVAQVLAWRAAHPAEASSLWADLADANDAVEHALRALDAAHQADPVAYAATLAAFASGDPGRARGSPTQPSQLRTAFLRVRALLQELGRRTGVPIEPDAQTRLLDRMMAVPGVLVAGVPGGMSGDKADLAGARLTLGPRAAGGFDAVFCLVCADAARAAVLAVWEGWAELSVSPLLARAAEAGLSLGAQPDV